MKLYIVYMHYNNPPMILFGETRAKVGRTVKSMLGPDMVNEVVPISNQDAEAQFGSNYRQQAQMNMLRSETVSVLTGDNPFLREKMDIKKADMGDVVDDFKKSDAPQFQGKSMAKRRQMAIAAKLNTEGAMKRMATQDAEKERLGPRKVKGDGMDTFKKKYPDHLTLKKARAAFAPTKGGADVKKEDVKLSEAAVDQKLIKTLKAMMKDGDAESVRLLVQGLPRNMKKDVMKKIGMKEQVDGRTKAFKETIQRLNMAKTKTVEEDLDVPILEDESSHYKMTYTKHHTKDNKLHLDVHHTAVDFKGERPNNTPRVKKLVTDSPQHKEMKAKGFSISKYGEHDDHPHHESIHGNKPTITKESVEEDLSPAQKDAREKNRIGPKSEVGKREYGSDKSRRGFHNAQRGVSGKGDNRNTMSIFDRQPKTALQGNKPKGKLPEENFNEKTADEQEADGGGHIVMQLRKSVSMRGQKDVKFNDGSTHKVSAAHADKFLSKHASLKTSHDKRALQNKAAKSHDHLQKSISEDDIEEKTPIRATIQDKKLKNLRVPNPNYKKMQDTRPERKKKMSDAFEGKDEVGIDKPEEATDYTSMDFFRDYIKATNKK